MGIQDQTRVGLFPEIFFRDSRSSGSPKFSGFGNSRKFGIEIFGISGFPNFGIENFRDFGIPELRDWFFGNSQEFQEKVYLFIYMCKSYSTLVNPENPEPPKKQLITVYCHLF